MNGVWLVLGFCLAQEDARPEIVAHRGASVEAPENTRAAFRRAFERGADAVEGDFYLSKDGVIVCHHDATLQRTAGVDRLVADCLLSELQALEVGSWKSAEFAGEPIPTLDQVLELIRDERGLLVEVKCGPEIVPALLAAIDRSKVPQERLRIIAFDAKVIAAVEKSRPALKTLWLRSVAWDPRTRWKPSLPDLLRTLESCGADGLDVSAHWSIDRRFVAALRRRGHEFHVWTVNDGPRARYFADLGVDSITTDRPHEIRRELAAARPAKPLLRARFDGDLHFEGVPASEGVLLPSLGSEVRSEVGFVEAEGLRGAALDLRGQGRRLSVTLPNPAEGCLAVWFRFTDSSSRAVLECPERDWRVEVLASDVGLGWRLISLGWNRERGLRSISLSGKEVGRNSLRSEERREGSHDSSATWTFGDGATTDGAWDECSLHAEFLDTAALQAMVRETAR